MLALLFVDVSVADGPTGQNAQSGVQETASTLNGMGPARPSEAPHPTVEDHRTVGASSIEATATTPVPDLVVSERPGASPLTVQLRLLDAYLRQVKRSEVPLTLAVARTSR